MDKNNSYRKLLFTPVTDFLIYFPMLVKKLL